MEMASAIHAKFEMTECDKPLEYSCSRSPFPSRGMY